MIEADTINELPDDVRVFAQQNLAGFAELGVIEAQIRKEKERIVDGDPNQPPEELAALIRNVRLRTQMLAEFLDLCQQYAKEIES
jgi:hypothetical protein